MARGGVRTNLCVDSAGPYTRKTMKAYSSQRSISAIFYGWVRTCYLLEVNNTLLLRAKVMRSQALTDRHGVPLTSRMQQFSQGTVPVWQDEHSIYFTLTNQQWHITAYTAKKSVLFD